VAEGERSAPPRAVAVVLGRNRALSVVVVRISACEVRPWGTSPKGELVGSSRHPQPASACRDGGCCSAVCWLLLGREREGEHERLNPIRVMSVISSVDLSLENHKTQRNFARLAAFAPEFELFAKQGRMSAAPGHPMEGTWKWEGRMGSSVGTVTVKVLWLGWLLFLIYF